MRLPTLQDGFQNRDKVLHLVYPPKFRITVVWNFILGMSVVLKACLHGGGGPQVGEVTRLGGVTRPSI